jgi:tetratricopeptide (TPR) repeat protein
MITNDESHSREKKKFNYCPPFIIYILRRDFRSSLRLVPEIYSAPTLDLRLMLVAVLYLVVFTIHATTSGKAPLIILSKYAVARGLVAPFILWNGFLPSRDDLPSINIPTAITKLHPLPEEELITAYNRGNSYLVSGRFDEALREFNHAADLDPSRGDVFLSRGIANEKLLSWEDAIDDYKKANELFKKRPFSTDDPTAVSNLANAETGLGRWEDALRDFTRAAQIKSDFLAPQIGRALVLYQLDRPQETFAFFQSLAVKYPAYADAQAALAVLYYEKGDSESAKDCWETALEQDSRYLDDEWVRDIRRWPPKLADSLKKFKSEISK